MAKKVKVKGLDKLVKEFSNIEKNLNSDDIKEKIGQSIVDSIKKGFKTKVSPFGKKWEPSKSNPDTLVDTTALRESIEYAINDSLITITGAGSKAPYGVFHNNGEGKFPQREFMREGAIPNKWLNDILKMLKQDLDKKIK
jgi:phage gpG-like protein